MTVDNCFSLVRFIVNKNMQGNVTPASFNMAIVQGTKSYMSYLLGSFQSYTPGRPVAIVELGQNSVVRQRLSPVIFETTLTIDNNGVAQYPDNFLQADAMLTEDIKRVRYVQQDSLDSYYNSTIDPVATNPIYLIKDTYLKFYPSTLGSAILSYIGNPRDTHWAYVPDANGRAVFTEGIASVPVKKGGTGYTTATIVFDAPLDTDGITATGTVLITSGVITGIQIDEPGTGYKNGFPEYVLTGDGTGAVLGDAEVSVDPVFNDLAMFEIITRTLAIIGVNLQNGAVSQYAEQIKREGQ